MHHIAVLFKLGTSKDSLLVIRIIHVALFRAVWWVFPGLPACVENILCN